MRPTEAQRAGAVAWIEKWRPRLLLHQHRIEPIWRSKACRDDDEERVTHAQTHYGDMGLVAQIEFFPSFWRLTPEMQERQTLHELLHIVAPEATEAEVNVLTEILWRAFESEAA